MEFDHKNFSRELDRIERKSLKYVNKLPTKEIISCGPPCVSEIIRMHLLEPPKLGEFFIEEDVFEIVNASTDEKTGDAGIYSFFPINRGNKKLLNHIKDQKPDKYPLGFVDSGRIKLVFQHSPQKQSEEELRKKIKFRKELAIEFVDSVQQKVDNFNKELSTKIFDCIQQRQSTINSTTSALKKSGLNLKRTGEREKLENRKGEILKSLQRAFSSTKDDSTSNEVRTFIVHGHDDKSTLELKNYIQNTLRLSEPIILHEQPSKGRTIIEKFEDSSDEINLVFILLTPDDIAASKSTPENEKYRARQNVIFEMGYFLAKLGRKSGRVIFLYEGTLELPSDINGIIYIDISKGIRASGEEIRKELEYLKVLK